MTRIPQSSYGAFNKPKLSSIRSSQFVETFYEQGEIFSSTGSQTLSESTLLQDSCVLVNKELNHRVLIKKSIDGTFSLFSCHLKNETFCPYEVNK